MRLKIAIGVFVILGAILPFRAILAVSPVPTINITYPTFFIPGSTTNGIINQNSSQAGMTWGYTGPNISDGRWTHVTLVNAVTGQDTSVVEGVTTNNNGGIAYFNIPTTIPMGLYKFRVDVFGLSNGADLTGVPVMATTQSANFTLAGPRQPDGSYVIPPTATPIINGFQNVSGNYIVKGQTAILNWMVTGATGLSIDNGVGNQPQQLNGGSMTVMPTQTTTYTLTATNANGSSSAKVTVTVGGITITSPVANATVNAGLDQSLNITWTSPAVLVNDTITIAAYVPGACLYGGPPFSVVSGGLPCSMYGSVYTIATHVPNTGSYTWTEVPTFNTTAPVTIAVMADSSNIGGDTGYFNVYATVPVNIVKAVIVPVINSFSANQSATITVNVPIVSTPVPNLIPAPVINIIPVPAAPIKPIIPAKPASKIIKPPVKLVKPLLPIKPLKVKRLFH